MKKFFTEAEVEVTLLSAVDDIMTPSVNNSVPDSWKDWTGTEDGQ